MGDPLKELNEDPAFRLLKKHGLAFMADVEQPVAAYEEYREDDLREAYEELGIDPEEAQLEAKHIFELAEEVRENNPEAFAQLREEYRAEHEQPA
jgi:hypothetical protein